MTWGVLLSMILLGVVKIVVISLPSGAVEWIHRKFEIHSKLSGENAIITIDGKYLEGEEKAQVIHSFNEATFLERYMVFPGYEQLYLHPENSGTPLVIDTKREKQDVRLLLYVYNDHVDVVKPHKKKVIAYKLLSDSLQKTFYAGNKWG